MFMSIKTYPLQKVREAFPSLSRTYNGYGVAYFDGPGGTQVAKSVIDAMASYMKGGVANLGGAYTTSQETAQLVDKARSSAATLLGAETSEIVFGANTTTLAFRIARALSREWKADEGHVVVTELDHHANIDPWVTAAYDKGIDVRTIPLNTDTLQLDYDVANKLINEETKLVAIGLASNAVGTINDVSRVIKRAKEVGALVVVDAVHAVPHFSVNFKELGADLLFCSVYKFFGPHVGIVAIKNNFYKDLFTFKLQPHPSEKPEKLETGTANFEGLVGTTAAIEWIASLGEGDTLRTRLESAYEQFEAYEHMVADHLRTGLSAIDGVTIYQAPDSSPKTPTVAFRVDGIAPNKVCKQMAELGIHIESGDFYAMTVIERLGLAESGGIIRAGIAPYNTEEEIDRLINGIKQLRK